MEDYHFGPVSFTGDYWINNKIVFKRPKNVNVDVINSGDFYWVFADKRRSGSENFASR